MTAWAHPAAGHLDDDANAAYYQEVGNRLRIARQARGYSLGDVEKKSGGQWKAGAVQSYERARRRPHLHIIAGLAGLYGVPVTSLSPLPDAEGRAVKLGLAMTEVLEAAVRNGSAQDREVTP